MQDPQQQFMEFIRILREGVPISTAADVAGYTAAQVKKLRSNWEIDRQIRIAMAEKERLVLSAMLRSAADGNTDAARWYLERRSDDWMTQEQRHKVKLARAKWKLEQEIIKAELSADPNRVAAQNAKALPQNREEDEED